MWITLVSIIGITFVFLFLIYNGVIGYMPDIEELKNPKDRFASIVYSADGQELGRFFIGTGNRVYADYDDISQHMIDALIATEDARFEDHSGIDVIALCRVALKTLILQQKKRRRRLHPNTATCQTAVFATKRRHMGACPSKTNRVDDCGKTRTVLL